MPADPSLISNIIEEASLIRERHGGGAEGTIPLE
jgi:hypothetical protein